MKRACLMMLMAGLMMSSVLFKVAAAQDAAPATQRASASAMAPAPRAPVLIGEGKGTVTLSWDEFVKITGYDPTRKGSQVLTIPWSEVESLLGVELKGKVGMDRTMVDLPWSDFKALLEWSIKKRPEVETPPPTDFIINSSQYVGVIGADAADFTLNLKLDVLRKAGWKRIPILPASVAMVESKLPEGVHLNLAGNVYELLTDKAGTMDVSLKFSVLVSKNLGISTISFERAAPGSSVIDLTFNDPQIDAKVAGSLSLLSKVDKEKNQTHVAAALPPGQPLNIAWERALPKAQAVPPKLYAETKTLIAVAEGILVCQELVDLNILHTAVRELKLIAPAGVSVLEVTGRNVQDWRVDKEGQILVTLRGEIIGPYNLRISYEAPIPQAGGAAVLRAVGVEREKGFVGVIALANVEIMPGKVEGATIIDVKELPSEIVTMTKQPVLLAFRYVSEKFDIPLAVKKHGEVPALVTISDSALFTTMQLDDGRRMTRVIYTVRNNRNQFLRVMMPEGADIWSVAVSGSTVSPAKDEQSGQVLIPLIRSAASAAELSSFPVEMVYVETPKGPTPAAGRLRVNLPKLDTPTMHVMVNYYAPAEGKYGRPGGLFTLAQSGFSGPLQLVNEFAKMTTDRTVEPVKLDAAQQAAGMQKQMEARVENEAKAAGVTPIRVRLPIDGKHYLLEKILALPGDDLYFEVEYSDWKVK